MLNSPIERIEQREISDAVASATNISAGIQNQTIVSMPIHEFVAALAKVAIDRQIPMYFGHEPNGNYLDPDNFPPGHHPTNLSNLITGLNPISYNPKSQTTRSHTDLRTLVRSMYTNEGPAPQPSVDSQLFRYDQRKCSEGYCKK